MIVRTGNIGECKRLGIPYLDITIGTGERAFAPHGIWSMTIRVVYSQRVHTLLSTLA